MTQKSLSHEAATVRQALDWLIRL